MYIEFIFDLFVGVDVGKHGFAKSFEVYVCIYRYRGRNAILDRIHLLMFSFMQSLLSPSSD